MPSGTATPSNSSAETENFLSLQHLNWWQGGQSITVGEKETKSSNLH